MQKVTTFDICFIDVLLDVPIGCIQEIESPEMSSKSPPEKSILTEDISVRIT